MKYHVFFYRAQKSALSKSISNLKCKGKEGGNNFEKEDKLQSPLVSIHLSITTLIFRFHQKNLATTTCQQRTLFLGLDVHLKLVFYLIYFKLFLRLFELGDSLFIQFVSQCESEINCQFYPNRLKLPTHFYTCSRLMITYTS
jgi:hypothetical protein